jgi:hypothetical protein
MNQWINYQLHFFSKRLDSVRLVSDFFHGKYQEE